MAVIYIYKATSYSTEALAQAAATAEATRMQNNPSDWMVAKEITGSDSAGWTITDTELTDSETLSPDSTKTYLCYSQFDGSHHMPLTSSELATKRNELRTVYGDYWELNKIIKIDDGTDPETITTITPTTDMSSYVS